MLEEYYKKSKDQHVSNIRKRLSSNKEEAEDIVQNAFIQALIYFHNYDVKKGKIANWFSKILYRSFLNYKKKETNFIPISNCHYLEDDIDYNLLWENKWAIQKKINQESVLEKRKVLSCYFLQGYSSPEISSLSPYTETNIRQICHQFRLLLKEDLKISL